MSGENTIEPAIDILPFDEMQWEILLAHLKEKSVIPIVGEEMVMVTDPESGERTTLSAWLAKKIFEKFNLEPDEFADGRAGLTVNDVVCAHVKSGGMTVQIYPLIKNLLEGVTFEIPECLRLLAEITDFGLYVTTTFDDLLIRAVNDARYGGKQKVEILSYAPSKVKDLPCHVENLQHAVVYHLLGQVSALPTYAISEEDILEWVTSLQSDTYSPERLASDLQNSHLLMLGCGFSDWLLRFFLRTIKRNRLSITREVSEFLADDRIRNEPNLVVFLHTMSQNTQICNHEGSTEAFVKELHRRWKAQSTEQGKGGAEVGEAEFVPAAELKDGGVFVSYSRHDLRAAKRVCASLHQAGVPVWFDMEQLESGNRFEHTIQNFITRKCRFFLPVISEDGCLRRREAYFRREWKAARRRVARMDDSMVFIKPVIIDETTLDDQRLPIEFTETSIERAPDGNLSEKFVAELRSHYQKD